MKTDRQLLVEEFFAMIRKLNRTGSDIMYVRDFFWKSSEIRGFIPPTVELMTVLKAYSPVVFHEFRKSLVPQSSMHILASVHRETGEALINLGITSVEQLEMAVKGRVTNPDNVLAAQ